jgi:hypothetical protein
LFKPFWCENNSKQSLPDPIQIGRPGHGGSKLLRKHEVETAHSLRRLRSRRTARASSLLDMMENIDSTAHFGGAVPIYEVLTTMGKDAVCRHGSLVGGCKAIIRTDYQHDVRHAKR